MIYNKYFSNYFSILFCLIPISILLGSSISTLNILIIDLSFIILIIYKKDFIFLKSKPIVLLLTLYIYLIFNTFISIDFSEGALRNLGFIRNIVFFAAVNYFFFDEKFSNKILKIWFIIISIVIFDVFIESYFGKNIFGFSSRLNDHRIVSFFKDEPVVGSFLLGFYFIIIGYLLNILEKKKLFFITLMSILFFTAIFLTGERSNSIKALIGLIIFILCLKIFDYKKKIYVIIAIFSFIFLTILSSDFLRIRFVTQIKSAAQLDSIYFKLYRSGYEVFKENKFFGVGNKNYRVETCSKHNQKSKNQNYLCNTHPHQIYFELISEHGIFGTLIILTIFFNLIFSNIIKSFKSDNNLKKGALIYLIMFFTPLLPSGAFFSNFMITIFIINLSFFYGLEKNDNIFKYHSLNNDP